MAHSRWLTTTSRALRVYAVTEKPTSNFKQVVHVSLRWRTLLCDFKSNAITLFLGLHYMFLTLFQSVKSCHPDRDY